MALPTASTPGYAVWHEHVGCVDVIAFLRAAEALGLARGLIREELDVVQLTGDADASAGVHSLGSAFDVLQLSDAWVRLFREMGAAFYPRTGAAWAGNEHGHGVIPCPHDARSAYQFTAYTRGYSGLGQGPAGSPYAGMWGYGSKDTEWRPATIRTPAQGIAWATAETNRLREAAMPTPDELARATWSVDAIAAPDPSPSNPTWAPGSYLRETFRETRRAKVEGQRANTTLGTVAADLGALRALVAQLVEQGTATPLTAEQITAATKAGAAAALAERIAAAEVTLTVAAPEEASA